MADVTLSALIDKFLQETTLSGAEMDSIREDLGIKTTDAVTFKNLVLTGLSLTGSQATGSVDIAATWNTTGTPTAFKINVTDTASNASSLLMDLQVGGNPIVQFVKRGNTGGHKFFTSTYNANTFLRIGSGASGSISYESNFLGQHFILSGDNTGSGGPAQLLFGSGGILTWRSTTRSDSGVTDLIVSRAAAASLQLGENHATTATNQTLKAHNVTTGTGADLILSGGTGSVASGKVRTSTLGVFALGPYTERIALTYSATLTPNCNDGLSRSVTMTGDQVINAPTNGVSGMILTLKMLASGADRELTFHADIKKPTGATYEATVASGSTRVIQLEYNGTAWMLIKNLEFVA